MYGDMTSIYICVCVNQSVLFKYIGFGYRYIVRYIGIENCKATMSSYYQMNIAARLGRCFVSLTGRYHLLLMNTD